MGCLLFLTLFLAVKDGSISKYYYQEGKKLMATADSVFTEVTNDLISGTIVVGHLGLILEHMDQFHSTSY